MIILGSNSPRRKQILSCFNLPFKQIPSGFDESKANKHQDPKSYVLDLATQKANHINPIYGDLPLITADTIISFQNQILEKPIDLHDNFLMLKTLSGQTHEVYTALCLKTEKKTITKLQISLVTFHELSDHNIYQYIKTFKPNDKSGGYSIQDGCGLLVKNLQGCYYNVLGMPITLLKELLDEIKVNLWDYLKTS